MNSGKPNWQLIENITVEDFTYRVYIQGNKSARAKEGSD